MVHEINIKRTNSYKSVQTYQPQGFIGIPGSGAVTSLNTPKEKKGLFLAMKLVKQLLQRGGTKGHNLFQSLFHGKIPVNTGGLLVFGGEVEQRNR